MKHLLPLILLSVVAPATVPWPEDGDFRPGDTVPDSYVEEHGCSGFFSCGEIPDSVFTMMQGRSYKEGCTVPRDSLKYLLCLHKDIRGLSVVGEMVVNARIADDVLEILRELYDAAYPIEKMRLVDLWDADDEMSMRADNSSCFNFRLMSGSTGRVSKHGLGMAIDINPLYNPYHRIYAGGKEHIEPEGGRPYTDRRASFPYKIERGDLCWRLFTAKGFAWGGDWTSLKDYQHFEKR